jgi:hypothetical protein
MPSLRRFPPPWTIEELDDACFVVSDNNGQKFVSKIFGDKATLRHVRFTPKSDIGTQSWNVRFVPKADAAEPR